LLEAVEELVLEALRLLLGVERRSPKILVALDEGFELEGRHGGREVLAELGVKGIAVGVMIGDRSNCRCRIGAGNTRLKNKEERYRLTSSETKIINGP
jgi:hypothetical protein